MFMSFTQEWDTAWEAAFTKAEIALTSIAYLIFGGYSYYFFT